MKDVRCWLSSLLVLACSVRTVEEATPGIVRNQCDTTKDCKPGRCSDGMCVAIQASLGTLLFEVIPPATSGAEYASVRYLKSVSGLDIPTALKDGFDLEFESVASVSGTVSAQRAPNQGDCVFKFQSNGTVPSTLELADSEGVAKGVPGSLTFTSTERLPGLPVVPYSVETVATGDKEPKHGFDLRMPPGQYDAYVTPWSKQDQPDSCAVPPQILRGNSILAGEVDFSVKLSPPQLLKIEILGPPMGSPLEGWRIDMIDPSSALVLSTSSVLGAAARITDGQPVYEAQLYYSPVCDVSVDPPAFVNVGHELVRLRPPEGVVGPSLFAERASLELFEPGQAVIEMDDLSQPVLVEGQLELGDEAAPVAAHLVFAAQKLRATNAGYLTSLTSFIVETDVGETGAIAVDLLPGTYSVRADPEPPACCLSPKPPSECDCPVPTQVEWEVSTEAHQAGKTLTLSPGVFVKASIKQPVGGHWLAGATASATAVPITTAALDELLTGVSATPGVFTTDTDGFGYLKLSLPSGQDFVFTVKPPDGSDYPWLVQPVLAVPIDLKQITQPLPVVYSGFVRVPSRITSDPDGLVEVPNALIRAYAYQGADGPVDSSSEAQFVVQVAETRADEKGQFELLVPSSFNE